MIVEARNIWPFTQTHQTNPTHLEEIKQFSKIDTELFQNLNCIDQGWLALIHDKLYRHNIIKRCVKAAQRPGLCEKEPIVVWTAGNILQEVTGINEQTLNIWSIVVKIDKNGKS